MKHTTSSPSVDALCATLAAHGLTLAASRSPVTPDLRVCFVGTLTKGNGQVFRFVRSYPSRVSHPPIHAMADALTLIALGYGETLEAYALSVECDDLDTKTVKSEWKALTKERELLADFVGLDVCTAIAAHWDAF